ncbi:hypothetical protein DESUT3_00980 [Desulfuromonas versatilis]|uniref:HEAT repeat domain-containing protein n=1 Tax=Desulfuromonas versatilis TaxID=2802975 RepID=A0ABN6DS19_9BACT|nr:hypothetical protein [Desulfuromonas versatilis]BCR03029.1 hypothetical protein DESUT3_00980 [Desulfuromonas versatilis]
MQVFFAQTHRDGAGLLFRQRSQWLAAAEADAEALGRLEQRLRLHLHVLARLPNHETEPRRAPEAFVSLAACLSSPDSEVREAARRQAGEWLLAGGPAGEGAFAALALFPLSGQDETLLGLYQRYAALRPILFELWRAQGAQVPPALFNNAELLGRSPELQRAALAYAADQQKIGVELFRAYYRHLLGRTLPNRFPAGVMGLALWGGMVRRDPEALSALRRGIELATEPAERDTLLRLAALSGDSELLPVLRSHLQQSPEGGCRLLALHGSREAARELSVLLQQPRFMEPAAQAWEQLTGHPLPLQPRLRLIEGKGGGGSTHSVSATEAAGRWLEENQSTWAPSGRICRGRPLRQESLVELALERVGRHHRDRFDLLALELGRPLGIQPENWMAERRERLGKLKMSTGQSAPAATREGRSHA